MEITRMTDRTHYPAKQGATAVWLLAIPSLALGQASPFMTGATALQTNILILRCSGSEHGGTSQFASRLIGEREVVRRQTARGRDREHWLAKCGGRRSTSVSQQHVTETAVLPSELEQLPDLTGYLKTASYPVWLKVRLRRMS
jgi:hypothetical protein